MHAHRNVAAALAVGAFWLVTGAPSAQTPTAPPESQGQPVFRAGASLVPVDVRVLDRDGKPVTGLTAADFTVLEDGVRQRIRHFSAEAMTPETPVRGPVALHETLKPAAPGDLPAQNYRVFLIVLGRGRLQPPAKGVDGMLHFVRERLLPQDRVAVLAWDRATDFTTDHDKIAELLERFKKLHEGIESKLKSRFSGLAAVYGGREIPPAIQTDIDKVFGGPGAARTVTSALIPDASRMIDDTRRMQDLLQRTTSLDELDPFGAAEVAQLGMTFDEFVATNAQSMQDLGNLYMGIEYLRHIDGEKHMVYVAESGLELPRGDDDRNLANVASDARVVIDYVHTGGLNMVSSGMTAETRGAPPRNAPANFRQMNVFGTARTLAGLTGGRFFGNQYPKVADDMDRIDESARFQYVLGYYPARQTLDGRYRRIDVRVNRPGLTVLFRHGYFARPEIAPFNRRAMLTNLRVFAAATYAQEVRDIKITAKASAPASSTIPAREAVVEVTIDPSRLAFAKVDARNKASVEVATFCLDDKDNSVGQTWQTMTLDFSDERLQHFMTEGIPYTTHVPVSSPAKHVKVVVYDYDSDLVGSAIVKVQ